MGGVGGGLAVFGVLLCMNMRAAVVAQQGDYTSTAQAAELDPYEWADYELSYVVSASRAEELDETMQEKMAKYMKELSALRSNSVPRYLAEAYFNMGDLDNAFAMLDKYVDYTPSNPETWESSFRLAMGFDDGSAAFRSGVDTLYGRLETWNSENLGAIELPEDIAAFAAGTNS